MKDFLQVSSFTDFALGAPILKALADTGYTNPTPIQAQAITPILEETMDFQGKRAIAERVMVSFVRVRREHRGPLARELYGEG